MEETTTIQLPEEYQAQYAHMFEKKKGLTSQQVRLFRRFSESYCLTVVLSYLGQRRALTLQALSRFFYDI